LPESALKSIKSSPLPLAADDDLRDLAGLRWRSLLGERDRDAEGDREEEGERPRLWRGGGVGDLDGLCCLRDGRLGEREREVSECDGDLLRKSPRGLLLLLIVPFSLSL
jgi:hypothetical protein